MSTQEKKDLVGALGSVIEMLELDDCNIIIHGTWKVKFNNEPVYIRVILNEIPTIEFFNTSLIAIPFEEILDQCPEEIQEELLFHLDLFT